MINKRFALNVLSAAMLTGLASVAIADEVQVRVTIENVAPNAGTFQTPYWVGFHDASFDTYNGSTPASNLPIPGSVAMERICEDGNTGPISEDFATLVPGGVDTTLFGPNTPNIAPGEQVSEVFTLDSDNPSNQFFSYASMILPSNDFCISNGNPRAHMVFNDNGEFVAQDFFVTGAQTLDAGTEVNDEIPANTAFFGQMVPNTGVDENGVIGTIGSDLPEMGFLPASQGAILADSRFSNADFLTTGFPFIRVNFDIVDEPISGFFNAFSNGAQEVPAVSTGAVASSEFSVSEDGEQIDFVVSLRQRITSAAGIRNVTMAHLHMAPAGQNGPVVVDLLRDIERPTISNALREISGTIDASELVGPLAGGLLQDLVTAMNDENIYVNIHTTEVPSGLIRGQVSPE